MDRPIILDRIASRFRDACRAVALLGPRQCGKTTVARQFATTKKKVHFFDLEDPVDLARLSNPALALRSLEGLVVIDEIQRRPDLFPVLRVLLDRPRAKTQFLILGSASRELLQQSSETLAGRISYIEMSPFSASEVSDHDRLWLRGGYPRSYLARSFAESVRWRRDYVSTFLERDIPQLGFNLPSAQMRRFWLMLTHYHGQTWNASEIAGSLGVSDQTARRYLDILTGTFMVRQLTAGYANISKRVVKAPKIYLRDSGVFHSLLGVDTQDAILRHPKLGASWEGFALESVITAMSLRAEECFYFGVHGQFEVDLYLPDGKRPQAVEVKFNEAPQVTSTMNAAIETLKLARLYVVYPGDKDYELSKVVRAVALKNVPKIFKR